MLRSALAASAALVLATIRPAAAQQPTYDHHFLDSTEYFIAQDSMSGAFQYVAVGRLVTPASDATHGEGQFLVVGPGAGFTTGQRVWTRYYWRTRLAGTQEAIVGAVVFCANQERDDVYRAPASRDEALNGGWWMTTITDISDLFRQEVRAGDHRLSLDCLRVPSVGAAGAVAATLAATPHVDAHFLDTAEYFIAPEALSSAYQYVALGRMVTVPTETSRGQAQFLVVGPGAGYTIGQRIWTQYYWKTRAAATAEAVVGKVVFCANLTEDDVYRPPHDRSEALNGGWWMTTITDTSDLFREEVRAGDHRLGLRCLRGTVARRVTRGAPAARRALRWCQPFLAERPPGTPGSVIFR